MAFDNEPFDWTHWKELVGPYTPAEPDVMGRGGSQAILRGLVPFEDREKFIRTALGYSWVQEVTESGGPAYRLRRQLPAWHPQSKYMLCNGASLHARNPAPEEQALSGSGSILTVKRPGYAALELGPDYAGYYFYEANLTFGNALYNTYDDELMEQAGFGEWERFTYATKSATMDVLASGIDFLKYAAGDPKNPKGNQFQGGPAAILNKLAVDLHWVDVAKEFVCDGENPVQFQRGAGCVNETEFLGWPAGTALLTGYTEEKKLLPLVTDGDADLYSLDVIYQISVFDPPRGDFTAGGAPEWKVRGHNLAPYANRLWYPTTTTGELDGDSMFRAFEFRKLFQHHSVT